jgi:hypothetical protein
VAAAAFERLRESFAGSAMGQDLRKPVPGGSMAPMPPTMKKPEVAAEIFAMLRTKDDVTVSRSALAESVEQLRDRARDLEARGLIVLGGRLARASGREILDEALRAFSGYHTTPVLEPRGSDLVLADTRLIFYYQNRLTSQGLAPDLLAHGHGAVPVTPARRGGAASGPERSAAS